MLIAFEGIDGAGKTTTNRLVAEACQDRGYDVVHLDRGNPVVSDEWVQSHLRRLAHSLWVDARDKPIQLLGEAHWIHLMAGYYSGLVEAAVRPAEERGAAVLIDNWLYKFVVKVSTNGQRTIPQVLQLLGDLREPDVVVLLDVKPEVVTRRRTAFSANERGPITTGPGDATAYQSQVRSLLLDLAAERGWLIHDCGDASAADIAQQVADVLTPLLSARTRNRPAPLGGDFLAG